MKRCSLVLGCLLLGGLLGTFIVGPLLQGQVPREGALVPKELTSYRDVVKQVLPAVVSIESRAKVIRAGRGPAMNPVPFDDERTPEEFRHFRRFFDEPQEESADEDGGRAPSRIGFGSGFLVDAKGVVLTNFHVVDGAEEVVVQLKDGRKFTSKDIKSDPKTDLAIVRIKAKEALPTLQLGDSAAMEIGDRVLAIGAPFGLTGTVTCGIVSAKGRSLNMNMYEDFVQTDAAINPGNSGGPLVNMEGKVIGISSAIKSRSGGFQGVGLAIASNLARNIMTQLLKDGTVHRGYLGVQIKDVDNADLARTLGLPEAGGVEVTRVFDNTPGSKAGLKGGDVIVKLDGKAVKNGHDLQSTVASLQPGQKVPVTIVREGQTQTLEVTIEEQPAQYGTVRVPVPRRTEPDSDSVTLPGTGLSVADLTPEQAEDRGFKKDVKGVLITKVRRNSVADEAGLRPGMVITHADKKPAGKADKLREQMSEAALKKGVLLKVLTTDGSTTFVLLKNGHDS
jgi:serine protease Do